MVFVSLPFLLMFFPLCMIFYIFAKDIKSKNLVLLFFSLFFYAWGEPKYVVLLLLMTVVDWFAALCIEKYSATKKFYLIFATIINLGLIGVFKYGTFFLTNTQNLFGFPESIPNIALPIGISFYTFQLLSYVIDVYRGDVAAQKKFHIVLLYASLFHQCIAGPIVRYKDVEAQLLVRSTNLQRINGGINRFCVGLAKKAVFANMCGKLVEEFIISDSALLSDTAVATVSNKPVVALWVGMLMYSLQIYLDFSAYSDMAIGMGKMIGIDYKENFDYPYVSRSVSEFWRRWHISLGSFFRDYVYIPLGGNRKGLNRTYFNLFVVWALTGFWHGASWNYVLWGLYFFIFIALEKAFLGKKLEKAKGLSNVYLLLIVYFGWVLFKFEDTKTMFAVLKGMFALNSNGFINLETKVLLAKYGLFMIFAIFATLPFTKFITTKLKELSKNNSVAMAIWSAGTVVSPAVLIFISFINIVGNSFNPFLYFQF